MLLDALASAAVVVHALLPTFHTAAFVTLKTAKCAVEPKDTANDAGQLCLTSGE